MGLSIFTFTKKVNHTNIKPDLLELESLRAQLIEKSVGTQSSFLKIIKYYNYFNKILSYDKPNLNEVFLKEFIDDYTSAIRKFEPFGIHPVLTEKIIMQFKTISTLKFAADNFALLQNEIRRIERQKSKLRSILVDKDEEKARQFLVDEDKDEEKAGQLPADEDKEKIVHALADEDKEQKAFFPLITKDAPEGFYGILESVTVNISKANEADKFIIVPSEKEIEKKIAEQCKTSWNAALDLSRAYIKKPYKYHEVIISFDKKEGFYEGSSLGMALTLSFFEQLLKFYNPMYIIKIKEQTAFTGGMFETGKILPTGEGIIKQKVKAVFFSEMNTFVIPKCEEVHARNQLLELQKVYPKRNLKLIPVEDIGDVLNRRDVVDVRKQKLIVRTGKFVRKNWVSAVATLLLAILFGYLFVVDWDDNPAFVTLDGQIINVKNKNEKLLWTQKFTFSKEIINDKDILNNLIYIVDINNDGKNEVLFSFVYKESLLPNIELGSLVCFNHKKELIWNYAVKDTVMSKRESIPPPHSIEIIDTLTIAGRKELLVFTNSTLSFASAIFKLDLLTGRKVGESFWCSGNTTDAFLKDINYDAKDDIIQLGHDNGFGDVVLSCLQTDKIWGYRPTTEEYKILKQPPASLISYIRFPKNDYELLSPRRASLLDKVSLYESKEGNDILFIKNVYRDPFNEKEEMAAIFYKINKNLKDVDIFIHDPFRVARDSLVKHGVLKPPYTDTKEYIDILKSKILYYKDGKWVKREEL